MSGSECRRRRATVRNVAGAHTDWLDWAPFSVLVAHWLVGGSVGAWSTRGGGAGGENEPVGVDQYVIPGVRAFAPFPRPPAHRSTRRPLCFLIFISGNNVVLARRASSSHSDHFRERALTHRILLFFRISLPSFEANGFFAPGPRVTLENVNRGDGFLAEVLFAGLKVRAV